MNLINRAGGPSLQQILRGVKDREPSAKVEPALSQSRSLKGVSGGNAFCGDHTGKRRVDVSGSVVCVQSERSGIGIAIRAQRDFLQDLHSGLGCANDDPAFDFLHSDERYRSIIQRIGLSPAY
jgi:hypothetical protein